MEDTKVKVKITKGQIELARQIARQTLLNMKEFSEVSVWWERSIKAEEIEKPLEQRMRETLRLIIPDEAITSLEVSVDPNDFYRIDFRINITEGEVEIPAGSRYPEEVLMSWRT